jgi:hypothetical protein
MEAAGCSETLIIAYKATWLHKSQDHNTSAIYELQENNDSVRRYNILTEFNISLKLVPLIKLNLQ